MGVSRFHDETSTRDVPVSQTNPLPVANGLTGALDDAAWDGIGDPASIIALLKYMAAQLAAINTNTAA